VIFAVGVVSENIKFCDDNIVVAFSSELDGSRISAAYAGLTPCAYGLDDGQHDARVEPMQNSADRAAEDSVASPCASSPAHSAFTDSFLQVDGHFALREDFRLLSRDHAALLLTAASPNGGG
jgi:hypothetical protein